MEPSILYLIGCDWIHLEHNPWGSVVLNGGYAWDKEQAFFQVEMSNTDIETFIAALQAHTREGQRVVVERGFNSKEPKYLASPVRVFNPSLTPFYPGTITLAPGVDIVLRDVTWVYVEQGRSVQ